MPDLPSNPDQLDEQLTAYLDGELSAAESRQIEDLIAGDEHAQKRLNQLAASWDLLEQLPRVAVGEEFARTTVEMVAVSTEEEIAKLKAAEPAQRRLRWLAAAAIALLAAGVGFAAVTVATPNENELLLGDLPVVVNFELYRPVGNVGFLKDLSKIGLFANDPPPFRGRTGLPPGERGEARIEPRGESRIELEKSIVTVPLSVDERRQWVATKLSAEEKLELRRNFERFSALPQPEQSALIELDKQLSSAPESDQMVRVVQRYNNWLRILSPAERGTLDDLPPEKKLAWIEQRNHDREAWVFLFVRGFQIYAQRHEAELLKQMPAETKAMLKKLKDDEERNPRGGLARYYSRLAFEAWRNQTIVLPPPTEEELRPIVSQLPNESLLKKRLEQKSDPADQVAILREAIHSGAFVREFSQRFGGGWMPGRRRSADWLNQFEANLSPDQKEKLKGLKDGDKQRAVFRMYQESRGSDRPPRFNPDFSGRGPSDGPPPDDFNRDGQFRENQRGGPRRGEDNRRRDGGRGGEGGRGDRNGPRNRLFETPPPTDNPKTEDSTAPGQPGGPTEPTGKLESADTAQPMPPAAAVR